jgi:LacI family transcriptional regulator
MVQLADWLVSLPKPVGIFTWNASSGRQIIHGCQWAGLKVPDQVAVLSGADDELLCEISNIPMSGLAVAAEQIGWEAASMLDGLMKSGRSVAPSVRLNPVGVVTRQSTDTLAMDDSAVAAAVRFIRTHPSVPIQVQDVVAQTSLSRRSLERHFREWLGRTISREIRCVHVERAKQLLVETNLSVPEVARASGFSSAQYLIYLFNLEVGQTPLQYRKKMQTA